MGKRYSHTSDLEDLGKAISWGSKAVTATLSEDPSRVMRLCVLGTWLLRRYEQLGNIEDLQQAIQKTEQAVADAPVDDPYQANTLADLAAMFSMRFKKLQAPEDEKEALRFAKEALALTPLDDPDRARMLTNLGTQLSDRYDLFGAVEDLDDSIRCAEEAISLATADDPSRAIMLSNLGLSLLERSDRTDAVKDLDQAVTLAEQALSATPPDDYKWGGMLSNLSKCLSRRYRRFGNVKDINRSIECAKQAVAAYPTSHHNRAFWVGTLAASLTSRYRQLEEAEDLEQAIKYMEEAIAVVPQGDPIRVRLLSNLSDALSARYRRFGTADDIGKSITLAEEVIAATPFSHPRRAEYLGDLGVSFSMRYRRFGDIADLEKAIRLTQEAVATVPPGISTRAQFLVNLGANFWNRYNQLGAVEDLEQAIQWTEKAVRLTPENDPNRCNCACNVGVMYSNRYDRFRDVEDLEKSIHWSEVAVSTSPPQGPRRAGMLGNLGRMIFTRFKQSGVLGDLEQATKLYKEALSEFPSDHPGRLTVMRTLGETLHTRYSGTEDQEDLDEAIRWIETAAASTPVDDPNRAVVLSNLSIVIHSKYRTTDSVQDFQYLLRTCYEVWHSHITPAGGRINVARRAAQALAGRKMWQESCSILQDAVKMMSKLSPLSHGRGDQEYRLSAFTSLAAEAVSIALQAGEEAAHCLRLLEFGRGVITGLVIDCRRDIPELKSQTHQTLFDKFNNLRFQLDSPLAVIEPGPADGDESGSSNHGTFRRREQMAHELEEILVSIRTIPGFEGFYLPPRSNDLIAIARDGPIVIFNSTVFRSDAIIITSLGIEVLPLPLLIYSSVEDRMEQMGQLPRGKRSTYRSRNDQMSELLLWLWDTAVEPVLNTIGLDAAPKGDKKLQCFLPRIWWIGVGLLAKAPFHASGDHHPGSTRNAITRVISSYIPTIKALSYARQMKPQFLDKPHSSLLLVTMPTTPGKKKLENAANEATEIMNAVNGKIRTTQLNLPSAAQVLTAIPSHDAVHFACHGLSDESTPSNSCLLLRKDDEILDKLTVGDISNTRMERGQIAFLSACSTAENASAALIDESIYIASGFQLAGFSHVLATQWISNDQACRRVATEFYSLLFSSQPIGGARMDGHWRVSSSFHHAVKKVRDDIWSEPLKWASFIHTGA